MKALLPLALAPVLATSFALPQQAGKDEQVRQLTPVDPTEVPRPDATARIPLPADPAEWKAELRSDDLGQRMQAYEALVRAARRDRSVYEELRRWAAGGGDLELAWTAQLALRELGRGPLGSGPLQLRLRDPFADPFADQFLDRGWGDWPDLFGDLQRQLDDLLQPGQPGAAPFGALPPGASGQSQSFRVQTGPDGVRVEVEEAVDGETHTKTYEADSLEELLDAHPELRDRIGVGTLGGGVPPGALQDLERMRDRLRLSPWGRWQEWGDAPLGGDVPTDKLGVLMREPGSWSASIPGVDPGVGLLVERALPNTIAGELGVQPGDVLIELDGRVLRSAEDVRQALAAREEHEPLVLTLVDAAGQRRTLTWKPQSAREVVKPRQQV